MQKKSVLFLFLLDTFPLIYVFIYILVEIYDNLGFFFPPMSTYSFMLGANVFFSVLFCVHLLHVK